MPLKLENAKSDDTIPIRELKLGQIAEIVSWDQWSRYIGEVVIRNPGTISGITFANVFGEVPVGDQVRVRSLPNGTKLTVADNE